MLCFSWLKVACRYDCVTVASHLVLYPFMPTYAYLPLSPPSGPRKNKATPKSVSENLLMLHCLTPMSYRQFVTPTGNPVLVYC